MVVSNKNYKRGLKSIIRMGHFIYVCYASGAENVIRDHFTIS